MVLRKGSQVLPSGVGQRYKVFASVLECTLHILIKEHWDMLW